MSTLQRRRMMMAQGVTYDGTPLMITNVGDENSVITLIPYGSFNAQIYYKKNNDKFYKKWNYNAITLPPNSTLSLFGDSNVFSSSSSNYANFSIAGSSIKLSGRLASISHTNGVTYTYYKLFQNCTSVVEVSSDFLEGVNIPTSGYSGNSILSYLFSNTGITQVPEGLFNFRQPTSSIYACLSVYAYMFKDCKSLVSVPQNIFAKETFICQKQYQGMFSGCSSLIQAPDIYATNAPWLSCAGMFSNCESLENPPQIAYNGYAGTQSFLGMFQGCISLKQSPTMNDVIRDGSEWGQHYDMFKGCSSLNHVEVSFTQWKMSYSDKIYYHATGWLANVSPTGTFICPKELADATDGYYDEEGNFVAGVGRGADTVPAGWTIDYPIIDARDGDANAMALMAVIFAQEWSKNSLYMMKSEAEKVEDIGTVFRDNRSIKNFEALRYFTKIKKIPDNAFNQCSNLAKISIPIQVTHLGTSSFAFSPQLGKIPSHITTFGNYPFQYSVRTSIDISEIKVSSTGNIFQYMYRLNKIEIPNQIKEISDSAFIGCSALTSFHVHKDITKIGIRPFINTKGSVKSITVADDNPIYDSRSNCNAIIETATNTLIAGCAKTIIPDGIKEIREGALQEVGLEQLTIPSSVIKIGGFCFDGYKGTYVDFPDTIVSNGSQIISNAPNLQEAVVGVNIKDIQGYSFYQCPKLTKLTFKSKSVVKAKSTSLTNTNTNLIVYVPSELVTAYQADSFWSKFNIQAIQ